MKVSRLVKAGLLCLFFSSFSYAEFEDQSIMVSKIKNSASPYVAMHAEDKVHWQEWGSAALEQSRKENKPIFLSIGYFSCYWCHVLQRESFKNDAFASRINDAFIPVIVDRELHASLDSYLIRFAEETIGRGGWPLNVVITPEGFPIVATVYLPVNDFNVWIKNVANLWEKDSHSIRMAAEEAADELAIMVSSDSKPVTEELIEKIKDSFIKETLSVADEFQGGFGDQAKFPLPSILKALLKFHEEQNQSQLADFLKLTLDNMRNRGLWDHLDSGFFRYTTGPDWQLPHFEKMLYDNAQLASLYFRAGKTFSSDSYTQTGIQLMDYLISNFQIDIHDSNSMFVSNNGGFYSSYSAIDEAGVEGGYYLWNTEQVAKLLSDDEMKIADLIWDWGQPSLLDEGFFPVQQKSLSEAAHLLKISTDRVQNLLFSATKKLKVNRELRVLPRDEKLLASWNALMLIALVDGYEATGLPRFRQSAASLAYFLSNQLLNGEELYRSKTKNQNSGKADLEDYAYTSTAMYRWSILLSGDESLKFRRIALKLANTAWNRFWGSDGWKMSDDMLIPNLSREAMIADGPLPSPSGMLIQLGFLMKDKKLRALSQEAVGYGHQSLIKAPFWYASHVQAISVVAKK